jgi:hypothetical protein
MAVAVGGGHWQSRAKREAAAAAAPCPAGDHGSNQQANKKQKIFIQKAVDLLWFPVDPCVELKCNDGNRLFAHIAFFVRLQRVPSPEITSECK